jgi:Cof subfamily protein (haloacid dehalogenase superfamily)
MVAYRLLVIDIDGTLLDGRSTLTPRTREAIRRAVGSGAIVTLATGRRTRSARPIIDDLGVTVPVILHNGAIVYDSARDVVLWDRHLPLAVAWCALDTIIASGFQPVVYENAFRGERLFAGPEEYDSPLTALYLRNAGELVERRPHAQLLRDEDGDPVRLAVMDDAARIRDLATRLASAAGCRTVVNTTPTMTRHGGLVLEVLAVDCSKGSAMAFLARHFDVPLAQVLAIGDHNNDVEMLQMAGLGVAVGNAEPAVLACADYVAPSNDDEGVAHVIERFVLGET